MLLGSGNRFVAASFNESATLTLHEVLLFSSIVLLTIFGSRGTLTPHESLILLAVTAASSFVVCLTSLTATALIAHRVIYVVKASTRPTRGLMHVVDIVVQSSALYSVVYLAYSISLVVEAATLSNGDATSILGATVASYLESLVSAVAVRPSISFILLAIADLGALGLGTDDHGH